MVFDIISFEEPWTVRASRSIRRSRSKYGVKKPRSKMSRRRQATKRPVSPDPLHGSPLITVLVNAVMKSGKKSVAQRIVYGAIEKMAEKVGKGNPIELVLGALENIRPKIEVKSRRVGGATYQVPIEVPFERQQSLAFRWVVNAAASEKGSPMAESLASEHGCIQQHWFRGEETRGDSRNGSSKSSFCSFTLVKFILMSDNEKFSSANAR